MRDLAQELLDAARTVMPILTRVSVRGNFPAAAPYPGNASADKHAATCERSSAPSEKVNTLQPFAALSVAQRSGAAVRGFAFQPAIE
jgi:hypothetical protein